MSRIMAKMNTMRLAFCVNCYLKPIKTLPHWMHSSASQKHPWHNTHSAQMQIDAANVA